MKKEGYTASEQFSIITTGTIINGDINIECNIHIQGEINGNVVCKETISIDTDGCVRGNIICRNLNMQGKLIGNANVECNTSLGENSIIEDYLSTSSLEINLGAIIKQGIKSKLN